jgi:hypothetical protein
MPDEKLPPPEAEEPQEPDYEPPRAEVVADEGSAATAAWIATRSG